MGWLSYRNFMGSVRRVLGYPAIWLPLSSNLQSLKGDFNIYKFDGVNDYVDLGTQINSYLSALEDYSIEIKFKNNGNGILLQSSVDTTNRFGLDISSTAIRCGAYNSSWDAKSTSFTDKTNYHIVTLNNNSGTFSAFLDSVEMTGTVSPSTSAIAVTSIGMRNDSTEFFDGNINYVKIYSDATQTNLVAYYDLTSSQLGVDGVVDLSGNGNHGTSMGKGEFTRTTSGTYIDINGVLQTAGTDVARFNYTNGVSDGLMVYEAATNLLTYSETLDNATGGWTETAVTVGLNADTAPDGTLTADRIIADSGTGSRGIDKQNATLSDNTFYTFSVFVKKNDYQWVRLATRDKSNDISSTWFDLVNGVVGTKDSDHTAKITLYGDYYRISVAQDMVSGVATPQFYIRLADADGNPNATGDGSKYNTFWGAMLN